MAPIVPPPPEPEVVVPHHAESRLNPPEPYSSEPNLCHSFLLQCFLTFPLQPSCFPMEQSKVVFISTLQIGKSREWRIAMWDNVHECCSSFKLIYDFSEKLHKDFDHSAVGTEATRALSLLQQGGGSVSDYSIEFCVLTALCGWNAKVQWDHFLHRLLFSTHLAAP